MLTHRILGGKELSVPRYMKCLTQEEIDEIHESSLKERIIACGVNEVNELWMITSDLEVKFIRPNGNLLPVSAFPTGTGRKIVIFFSESSDFNVIDSKVAIKYSNDALSDSRLYVSDSYMCDLQLIGHSCEDDTDGTP